jgi:hypothetical protein
MSCFAMRRLTDSIPIMLSSVFFKFASFEPSDVQTSLIDLAPSCL